MKYENKWLFIKSTLSLIVFSNLPVFSYSQISDSKSSPGHFGGTVTVTTKGISTIPNLTLGKPAAIFDMSVGKRKLSFEPSFRFALDGKPWSFLFWWRYELLNTERFVIKAGAHPALAFRTVTYTTDGVSDFLWNLSLVYTFNKKYVEM